MKRVIVFLFFVITMAAWCTPSFAVFDGQLITNSTPTSLSGTNASLPGSNTGVAGGVQMTGQGGGGRLNVGAQDIFTENKSSDGIAVDSTISAVSTDVSSKSNIYFSGNSTVYGTLGSSGGILAEIHGATADTTVKLLGNVSVERIIFDTDSTINLAAGKTVSDGAAVTTTGNNIGTLVLGSGSTLGGAGVGGAVGATSHAIKSINIESNVAGVSATISGAVFSQQFSLLTNTLNIGGALTISTGGTINTTLASSSVYGRIIPAGAVTLTSLGINVTVPSGTYIPLGTLFDIIDSVGAMTDNIIPTITPVGVTNPLYTFAVEPITGTAATKLTIKTTGTPIRPANPVSDPVADVVAPALGILPATAPVIIAINALTTADAVAKAEAQLAPSTASLASPLLTYQGVRQFQSLWLNRLDACGQVSWPSENKENCKGSTADNGWWLKGFGYFGQQDSRSGFTSYDARILGSMIAYDRSLGVHTRAGVGVGYARTNIKGTVYDANTESDTYRAVAYIGHEMGSWFFDGSGSFGWNEYRDRRHVEFPGMDTTAKSKYNGQDYTAFGRAGFHFPSIFELIMTPMASLQYTRINIDGHTEKGSTDDINMRVRSQHYDYLETGLGGKVERPFNYNNKFTFVPEAHFEWLHKLSNPRIKQTAVYVDSGSAFTTPSLRTVADSYHAGVGLNLLSCACSATVWSVEVGYDYYWRTDGYAANQVSMRASRRF